jgi:hypothetical protein
MATVKGNGLILTMNFLKWLTPFTILIAFLFIAALYVIITGGEPEGVRYLILPVALITIVVAALLEFVLRKTMTLKLGWIWLIESLLLLVFIYYLIVR